MARAHLAARRWHPAGPRRAARSAGPAPCRWIVEDQRISCISMAPSSADRARRIRVDRALLRSLWRRAMSNEQLQMQRATTPLTSGWWALRKTNGPGSVRDVDDQHLGAGVEALPRSRARRRLSTADNDSTCRASASSTASGASGRKGGGRALAPVIRSAATWRRSHARQTPLGCVQDAVGARFLRFPSATLDHSHGVDRPKAVWSRSCC